MLHRKYGIVKTVLSYARAIVTVEDKDMLELQVEYKKNEREGRSNEDIIGTRDLNLLNKTGEVLEVGDAVWIYYWHDVASGYIAVRIGAKQKEKASVRINRAAVLPTPTPNNIYSNAKIYPDYVWDETISSRTYFIDDDKNLTFQTGAGGYAQYPQFNLFLVNGFPVVIINCIWDFYKRGGNPNNRQYIVEDLNKVNPKLFTQTILARGSLGLKDLLIDPTEYSFDSFLRISGELKFEVFAYYNRQFSDYYRPVIKVTCDGEEHLVSISRAWTNSPPIPEYHSEAELLDNVSMILVSTGSDVTYTSLRQQSIDLGIAIRCKTRDGDYAWGLMNSLERVMDGGADWYYEALMGISFGSIDEYYYCLCVK